MVRPGALDPRSSGLDVINLWTWFTDEVHPGYWFGVPLVNYAGWFLTVFTFTFLLRLEDDGTGGILSPANHRFGLLGYGGALLLLFVLLLPLKVVVDLLLVHGHEAVIVLREDHRRAESLAVLHDERDDPDRSRARAAFRKAPSRIPACSGSPPCPNWPS